MKWIDSHAHYNDEKFNEDREKILRLLKEEGIKKVITAGYSLQSSKEAIKISDQYPFIYNTIGISPNDIPEQKEELKEELEQLKKLASLSEKTVAIGEIGLDYHWNTENKEIQQMAFKKQIKLANDLKLPIVIHTREAVMDTIQILKENLPNEKGVFHCCPLNRELVKEALKLGFYISFAGPVTFKNSKNANEIIEMVPDDKILVETDSPYLSPEPNRGKRNDSRNIRHIVEKIAQVKQKGIEEVTEMIYQNLIRLFKIENEK